MENTEIEAVEETAAVVADSTKKSHKGLIIGGVALGAAAIGAGIFFGVKALKKKKAKAATTETAADTESK